MPIKVGWYDERQRIWSQVFTGSWTLDEYWESVDKTHRALDSVAPHPVYIFTEIRGTLRLPPGMLTALRTVSAQARAHERIHVIIGGGMIVRSLFRVGQAIVPNPHIRLADTLEEALMLIEQMIVHDQTRAKQGSE
ncbi:MAG: hypothetical protein NZ750_11005 [Anaerolineae bacterium]|nr:hypothetical protein [Anaerolineae bacterium]MDW8171592.1 hypothetical protein [Anaerolineae bacterium]